MPTPIEPGQRRHAAILGRTLHVFVVQASRYVGAHWICRDMASNQMYLIAESCFESDSTPSAQVWREAS